METLFGAGIVLGLLVLYLILGVWVFAGLILVGITTLYFLGGFTPDRIGSIMEPIAWGSVTTWEIAAIPMFIWMGEIVFRTRLAERLFEGIAPLVGWIPGRQLHMNVAGCTFFAMVSGSSSATTATIGRLTLAELHNRGYSRSLSLGSLAGAGSLGLLLPPSIIMIIYGVMAEVSISQLFAAGVIPGLLIASLYSLYIVAVSIIRPGVAPDPGQSYSLRDALWGMVRLAPLLVLIMIVLGGIYSGFATPSEAAALGVAAIVGISLLLRLMSWRILCDSAIAATRTSCMIIAILVGASFLSTVMGYMHIPGNIAAAIATLDLGPFQLLLIFAAFYILLGLFLDGISMIVMTIPITLPLAIAAGFDPIWFGIFLVIMTELAQITPPVGINLFVLQGISGRPIGEVAVAALPFFMLMCLGAGIVAVFPELVLWLPELLFR